MPERVEPVYHANLNIVTTDLEDELVLLDPHTQELFSLNVSGRLLWLRLPASQEQLTSALSAHFGISHEQAQRDVQSLLKVLLQANLIQEQEGS